ncbi:hypothetical protein [Bdellovibrio sp. BCCA]|uniref:hypothetical protein n=1 Tax=Bdellovibrio sp. BCCA TaxID=3136281 RepID=UPI0030F045B2
MAKKAAKKEAPAAKAKKAAAKPAAKAPAKAKAPAAKPAAAKAKAAPPPPAKAAKAEKPSKAAKSAPAPEKVEKKSKIEAAPAPVEVAEAPKKEKKVKIDKTGLSEDQVKWHELHEKYKAMKAPSYSISGQFEAKTPLQHKIFGWGFVLSNEYDRLEVLFEDGKRMLISNRKLS